MPTFTSFEEIDAWQEARVLTASIYALSNIPPFRRDFELCRQLRSAGTSIMSNIAEGYERGGRREFLQFLSLAKGSCGEVRSQFYVAFDAGYIAEAQLKELVEQAQLISKLIQGLIRYLQRSNDPGPKFRGERGHEPA